MIAKADSKTLELSAYSLTQNYFLINHRREVIFNISLLKVANFEDLIAVSSSTMLWNEKKKFYPRSCLRLDFSRNHWFMPTPYHLLMTCFDLWRKTTSCIRSPSCLITSNPMLLTPNAFVEPSQAILSRLNL